MVRCRGVGTHWNIIPFYFVHAEWSEGMEVVHARVLSKEGSKAINIRWSGDEELATSKHFSEEVATVED